MSINVSALFFADDIVLLGRTSKSLDHLMHITRTFFSNHHLQLSVNKSQIMTHNATTGKIIFRGNCQMTPLTLDQVLSYKYLGISLSSSPYGLFRSFNEQVKTKAKTYLHSVLSLAKTGPDRSELAYTLWTLCALPSILYGAKHSFNTRYNPRGWALPESCRKIHPAAPPKLL